MSEQRMDAVMDPDQVAKLLHCSARTVEDHARAGRLPGLKFGDGWVFPVEALLRAVNRIAEEEAVRRQQPEARPAAVKAAPVARPPRRRRPDLALLAQTGG